MQIKKLLEKYISKKPPEIVWQKTEVRKTEAAPLKIGVAFYYKNIDQYPPPWINKCIESMRQQTYNDFDVYVLNYGERDDHSFDFTMGNNLYYLHKPLGNYADAMNFVYSKIFETCDVSVNTNIDDFYSVRRIEALLQNLKDGADIASSNFRVIDEYSNVTYSPSFNNVNIYGMLCKGLNPVSNPCHLMKKAVFDKLQFDSTLVPVEDMDFWKKAIESGFKIAVNKRYLHYYRMHPKQATHQYK